MHNKLSDYIVDGSDIYRSHKKNLRLNQIASDKQAFPFILGETKRDLQEKAFNIDGTMHGIGKIILVLYFEREKLIASEPNMDKRLLTALHLISVEEVQRFIDDYKKNNTKPARYNIELIKMAIGEIMAKRKLCLQKSYERKLERFEKSPQLHFNFYR